MFIRLDWDDILALAIIIMLILFLGVALLHSVDKAGAADGINLTRVWVNVYPDRNVFINMESTYTGDSCMEYTHSLTTGYPGRKYVIDIYTIQRPLKPCTPGTYVRHYSIYLGSLLPGLYSYDIEGVRGTFRVK
jgi:hypothetical protein